MEDDEAFDTAEDEDDEAGLAWYAAAAAGGSDDEVAENAEDALASLDPYLASEDPGVVGDGCPDDPYLAADPYSESNEAQTPAPPSVTASDSIATSATGEKAAPSANDAAQDDPVARTSGLKRLPPATAETSDEQPSTDVADETATTSLAQSQDSTSTALPPRKVQKTQAHAQMSPQQTTSVDLPASIPAPLAKPNQKLECSSEEQSTGLHAEPSTADLPKLEQHTSGKSSQAATIAKGEGGQAVDGATSVDSEVPDVKETSVQPDVVNCEEPAVVVREWDADILVVRQGQVHIELQRQTPPMADAMLLDFCVWLDQRLPGVVSSHPYVKKSGAYVDLSDNAIGPKGLDRLFQVLRDHRVPCLVLKAYRNVLDDSIVDTLVEYLYTQPEAYPMHGIHISHNVISDKGALRLIRATALCGHYPRYTSRLPLWLRLEANEIQSPQKILAECFKQRFHVCLMGNGLCSRPNCNHYSGVHVQLPYFFNQGRRSYDDQSTFPEPILALPVESLPQAQTGDAIEVIDLETTPDWKRKHTPGPHASLMVPAPKKQSLRQPTDKIEKAAAIACQPGPTDDHALKQATSTSRDVPFMGNVAIEISDAGGNSDDGEPAFPESGGGIGRRRRAGIGYRSGHQVPQAAVAKSWADLCPPNRSSNGAECEGDLGPLWTQPRSKWGGFRSSRRMWQGPSLQNKAKTRKDIRLAEGEGYLGFKWRISGPGCPPEVVSVDPTSKIRAVAQVGDALLRLNGLDTTMFSESQVNDILKQRPLSLRFGEA